ncbi:MAG: outer rane lipoprotein omp16 precursor [Chitinophagaceae bacterium]|nr:outer rane lipoprotein omp16 precursor [Chitinophagaceae bacterium]
MSMAPKKILPFLMLLFISVTAFSQRTVNPKAEESYNKAMLQLRDGLVRDAIPLLGRAIELDKNYTDAYLSLAGVYAELKDYKKSIAYYESAQKSDPEYFKYYLLPYSISLAGLGRFEDALTAANNFLTIPKLGDNSIKSGQYRKGTYEFAINYAKTHTANNYVFNPVNLGDSINSANSEYYPSVTINDSLFVFTRRNGNREDFMSSNIAKSFSHAEKINGDINIEPFKGAINISADGEWLVFAGDFGKKGLGSYDIYISYNTPSGWSEPMNLGPNVNSDFWETSPSLSPDRNALYFASNRPGGYGGSDIYVCYRQSNGNFGPAKNLGPAVNTAGDEKAPFIHVDNKTLYFTSSGLLGYGNSDLFIMRKQDDGTWGKPENLGYPINTIDDEGSIFITADGTKAYYASDRFDTRGGLDLYQFTLREDVRPAKTLYVEGTVTDSKTRKPLPSAIELIDNRTRQMISKLQTDETGYYFVTLPVGSDYTFSVNRKGYLFYTDIYNLSAKKPDSTYKKNILLEPIQVNATLTLKNILFPTKSYELEPISRIELDKLYQFLADNPSVKILITGHTDNVGSDADNLKLSENRSKMVRMYLANKDDHGIAIDRMTVKGFGASKPIADNKTEEGRAKNRRTEITITSVQ